MENKQKKEGEATERKVTRYGGYSSRFQYEKSKEKKRSAWSSALQILLLLALVAVLALCAGVLYKVFLAPPQSSSEGDGSGTVKVPTQAQLNQIAQDPGEMLEEVEYSMITLEVTGEDGARQYGTGFMISTQGYALCSSKLVHPEVTGEVRAYDSDGLSYSVSLAETVADLGFSVIHLQDCFGAITSSVGNFSFVDRGEVLYVLGSVYPREYYGTALSGIAASVGKNLQVTLNGKSIFVPVVFLDVVPNESLYGGPVVDSAGNVIGFCTDAVTSPYGNLTGAVSINVILSLVNDLLGEN